MFSSSAYIILYIYKITHLVWPKRRTCTKLCHLKTVYSNRIHINRVYYMYPHFMYRYMYRYTEIIWYIRYTIRYSWSLRLRYYKISYYCNNFNNLSRYFFKVITSQVETMFCDHQNPDCVRLEACPAQGNGISSSREYALNRNSRT